MWGYCGHTFYNRLLIGLLRLAALGLGGYAIIWLVGYAYNNISKTIISLRTLKLLTLWFQVLVILLIAFFFVLHDVLVDSIPLLISVDYNCWLL